MRISIIAGSLALVGLVAVGCGDDEETPNPTGVNPTTTTTTSTGGGGTGGSTTSSGGGGTGGMAAMPRGEANPPTLGMQIDRQGRAAANTALNNQFNPDETARNDAKDAYNQEDDPTMWTAFIPEIASNLAVLDGLDGDCGNQPAYAGPAGATSYDVLATILANDAILVATEFPTGETECASAYLGLEGELAAVAGTPPNCGGRTPTADVIDRTYSVLAIGELGGVGDNVDADDATHSDTAFPFLAAPQ